MAMDMETWAKDEAAAWSSQDIEKALSFYTDDCVYEDVALGRVNRGKEEIRAFLKECFTKFPDVRLEMTSFFASGNRLCIEAVMSGTDLGDLPGKPATGKAFSVRYAHICELRGDKASRVTDYWDLGTMLRQQGVVPPPPQS